MELSEPNINVSHSKESGNGETKINADGDDIGEIQENQCSTVIEHSEESPDENEGRNNNKDNQFNDSLQHVEDEDEYTLVDIAEGDTGIEDVCEDDWHGNSCDDEYEDYLSAPSHYSSEDEENCCTEDEENCCTKDEDKEKPEVSDHRKPIPQTSVLASSEVKDSNENIQDAENKGGAASEGTESKRMVTAANAVSS